MSSGERVYPAISGDREAMREAQIAVYHKLLSKLELSIKESSLLRAQVERCEALVCSWTKARITSSPVDTGSLPSPSGKQIGFTVALVSA